VEALLLFLIYGGGLVIAFLLMFAAHGLTLLPRARQTHPLTVRLAASALICIVAQGIGWWLWMRTGLKITAIGILVWLVWFYLFLYTAPRDA
jgi:hypothetical protein